ncbi:MAG: alpha/beta fold hydrolase [Shimia sp.]
MSLFPGFRDDRVALPTGVTLRVRHGGSGPPLILLHGYPQTGACWHAVAPALARDFTVIVPDLRGYGGSDAPPGRDDHATYAKRAMAADVAALARAMGHARFAVAGHDRGGRVAHRLARDHRDRVSALAVLDIVPTAHVFADADTEVALAYYHWFFLAQPAPLPETLIVADPGFWLRAKLAAWGRSGMGAYAPAALAEYEAAFDAATIHASCEDYRAGATIDLTHDAKADAPLPMPLLALWGGAGFVGDRYDVLETWRAVAADVRGHALPCGHFLPEERPEETGHALAAFFRAHPT